MKQVPVLLALLFSAWGLSAENSAWIFCANFSSDQIDVRIGNDDTKIFSSYMTLSDRPTTLTQVHNFGFYPVFSEPTLSNQWKQSNQLCAIAPGHVYCVVITPDGNVSTQTMDVGSGSGTHIAFINESPLDLPYVEIGVKILDRNVAWANNLTSGSVTGFTSATPGRYSVYHQTRQDVEERKYTTLNTPDDQVYFQPFLSGHWYVCCCYPSDDDDSTLRVFDITP